MKKLVLSLAAVAFAGAASASAAPAACPPQVDAVDQLDLRDPIHRAAFAQIFELTLWMAAQEKAYGYRENLPSIKRIDDAVASDRKQVDITGKSPQAMAIYREIRNSRMHCK